MNTGPAKVAVGRDQGNDPFMGLGLATRPDSRPSRRERERVTGALNRACVEERLSSETFIARLDLVYAARTRVELDRLIADLPERSSPRRFFLTSIGWWSGLTEDVRRAWLAPRLPRLILPPRAETLIGRSRLADLVVADQTVSSRHALLRREGDDWIVHDAGSTNGTFVNGWRVVDPIVVRPGDELTFGETTFMLVLPPA